MSCTNSLDLFQVFQAIRSTRSRILHKLKAMTRKSSRSLDVKKSRTWTWKDPRPLKTQTPRPGTPYGDVRWHPAVALISISLRDFIRTFRLQIPLHSPQIRVCTAAFASAILRDLCKEKFDAVRTPFRLGPSRLPCPPYGFAAYGRCRYHEPASCQVWTIYRSSYLLPVRDRCPRNLVLDLRPVEVKLTRVSK